ncbi:MAG: sigma-70 family RNA polymerase sigma factor [Myxococcales bacterium]|nr:sigma-70 family RNA polymerase sigma factor [Myxococcales bacterium]
MTTTPTDAELIKASISGKISAFGKLIERYQNLVCSVAFSTTGDRALSEDVGQETFVAAWKQLPEIQEPALSSPWFCSSSLLRSG